MANIDGTPQGEEIVGTAGSDRLRGFAGDDVLVGLDGSDALFGGDGGEGLFGGPGMDRLFGGNNDDFALEGGAGSDTIDGGAGNDRVRFREATEGVVVDLAAGTARDGQGGVDRLVSIERIEETPFDDVLRGTEGRNVFRMNGGGNDIVDGRGESDRVEYTEGVAAIHADLRRGVIGMADGSVDRVRDIESVYGTVFADTILGADSDVFERFRGGAGNDHLDARRGGAGVDYEDSPNGVVVDLRDGRALDGFGSRDTIRGFDNVEGSLHDDILRGGRFDFFEGFSGRAGDDTIDGRSGYDRVSYLFDGGAGPVKVDLAAGVATDTWGDTDRLISIEDIEGTAGDDVARGSAALFESFRMMGGSDTIDGRGGIDRVDYSRDEAGVQVDLATHAAIDGFGGHDRLFGIENARGSAFADLLRGDRGANRLEGGVGDDRLVGRAGDDQLVGDVGYDVLIGGAGLDTLWGGGGRDRFVLGTASDGLDDIADFDLKDVLDLRQVTAFVPGDEVDQFIRLRDAAGDTWIQVDANGRGDAFVDVARLIGVTGLSAEELVSADRLFLD